MSIIMKEVRLTDNFLIYLHDWVDTSKPPDLHACQMSLTTRGILPEKEEKKGDEFFPTLDPDWLTDSPYLLPTDKEVGERG
jgi:hypothetical protein